MTPSELLIHSGSAEQQIVDQSGRELIVRRLTALDTLRLVKLAGPILSQNDAWLSIAALAYSVSAIEGTPVVAPVNEAQIEAIVVRLGEVGLDAVAQATSAAPEGSGTTMMAAVGNSRGTPT